MIQAKRVKLFKNGASQAVRLPAEFRFDTDQVYISRDERTQDVVLSTRPGASIWKDFFDFVRAGDVPSDELTQNWMKDRPLNVISPDRKPLFSEDD